MFKTIFCKLIWDGENPKSSKYFAILQREEDLPFAPTPGVEIFWGDEMPQALVRVRWEVSKNSFVCHMEDEFPYENEEDIYDYDFDWLVTRAVDVGWTLISKQKM